LAATPPAPFSEVIDEIVITAVMPGQKRFLVGMREFSQYDRFEMSFRGKRIPVEVTSVTSREVSFRNLETDEVASSRLELLPPGMSRGNPTIVPAGMDPAGPDAPLQIGGLTDGESSSR
jgi:hypothetical protein